MRMLHFISDRLATLQGRVAAGCVFASAITVSLLPGAGSRFDVIEFLGIASTGALWLFAELSDSHSTSEHDIVLFRKFESSASHALQYSLSTHDFSNSFKRECFDGLTDISYLDGARHEFVDQKVQKKWNSLKRTLNAFLNDLSRETFNVPGDVNLSTVYRSESEKMFPPEDILMVIDNLNSSATKLSKELADFERYTRKKLGI